MLWSIALGVVFLTLILPYQGHGWGYRYFHPYLGNFALLAGIGYQRLAATMPRRTEGMIVALSLLTAFGSLPWLIWHQREFTRPQVALDRYVAQQKSDFVLINTEVGTPTSDGVWAINAIDEVRNGPDLTNRPLRFSSRAMDAKLVAELCRRGTVSIVGWPDIHRLGFGNNVIGQTPRFDRLVQQLRERGCLIA